MAKIVNKTENKSNRPKSKRKKLYVMCAKEKLFNRIIKDIYKLNIQRKRQ